MTIQYFTILKIFQWGKCYTTIRYCNTNLNDASLLDMQCHLPTSVDSLYID